ncbi:hypothetical protein D9758_001307 [Tetrapyrgos nigripes]|uniref:Uncharacterized protein n=1 Tax=Tetrapyrgos nigripes TaxID=182062 RepID=A0A8H5GSH3_9AGAR|nr:hypothetical protein D9758_001307 [Tetrapyrgos nigripes]
MPAAYLGSRVHMGTSEVFVPKHNVNVCSKKRKWSLSKVLYLLNRYLAEILLGLEIRRGRLYSIQGYLNMILIWIASFVMMMRIYAIYSRSRYITISLIFLLVVEVAAMLGFRVSSLLRIYPAPEGLLCARLGIPVYFPGFWIVPAAVETVLFAFLVCSGIQYARTRKIWSSSVILDVLLRDHVIYFLVIEVIFICNVVSTLYVMKHKVDAGKIPWLQIPYALSLAFMCNLVSRLILNLQAAYYAPMLTSNQIGTTASSLRWHHETATQSTFGIVFDNI